MTASDPEQKIPAKIDPANLSPRDDLKTDEFFNHRRIATTNAIVVGFGISFVTLFLLGVIFEYMVMTICSLSELVEVFIWAVMILGIPYSLLGSAAGAISVRLSINRAIGLNLAAEASRRGIIHGSIAGLIIGFIPPLFVLIFLLNMAIRTGSLC